MPAITRTLDDVEPIYEDYPGWMAPTSEARTWGDLPERARQYLERLGELVDCPIGLVSTGAEREATLQRFGSPLDHWIPPAE